MTASVILANATATAKNKQDKYDTLNVAIAAIIINYTDEKDEAN